MTLRARATRYLGDALRGVGSAPVEVLVALCVAATFSAAVELGDASFRAWAETAVACALILAVAWTGTLLHALGRWDSTQRRGVTLAGAVIVATYAIAVQDFTWEAEAWRAALLVAAALLWVLALPAFGGPAVDRVERMRRIDGRLLLRIVGAALYGAALFAGLALALRAVDVLFELSLDGDIYGHVFGWIFFALVPLIVLGGLPDYVKPLDESNAVATVAQRIVLYLVPPLLAIYYLILLAYIARIFVTGEVPKNLVSPLVLAAGGLSALGLLLFDPRPGAGGLARWLRFTPPLFLPVAGLGFWALLQRTDQYGLTEFRVIRFAALVALDLLALAATLWLVKRRPFPLHAVPLALAAVALVLSVGPWSALALSRRSQQVRLRDALVAVDVSPLDTAYVAPPDSAPRIVPTSAYEQIRSSAQYLAAHFGPDALPPVLRGLTHQDDARWFEYATALGLRPDSVPERDRHARGGALAYNAPIRTAAGTAYRVAWPSPEGPGRRGPAREDGVGLTLVDSSRVALRVGGLLLHAELANVIAHAEAAVPGPGPLAGSRAVAPLVDSSGVTRGELIVWHVWMQPDSARAARIGNVEGLAIIAD